MSRLAVHFSTGKDNWQTPYSLFQNWNQKYQFTVDAAADMSNAQCVRWYGPGGERPCSLAEPWDPAEVYWMNSPYSRGAQIKFVAQAVKHAVAGGRSVALMPARTDTVLWHSHIWSAKDAKPHWWCRRVNFLKGRVTFVGAPAPAPFPSVIVEFGA